MGISVKNFISSAKNKKEKEKECILVKQPNNAIKSAAQKSCAPWNHTNYQHTNINLTDYSLSLL
jgi:hypothetical protein